MPDEPLPRRDPDPADDTAAITLHAEPASWITWTLLGLASAAAVAALVWTRRRWIRALRRVVRRYGLERT